MEIYVYVHLCYMELEMIVNISISNHIWLMVEWYTRRVFVMYIYFWGQKNHYFSSPFFQVLMFEKIKAIKNT